MGLVKGLRLGNILAATALGCLAFYRLIMSEHWVPFILFLGLMVVGPVEDWLRFRYVGRAAAPRQNVTAAVIDQATSLGLILALLIAALGS